MPLFSLSSLSCHRFIISSIVVSSKGLCDAFCPNTLYAKVGGISVTELNLLEREFLQAIEWRLMVSRFPFKSAQSATSYLSGLVVDTLLVHPRYLAGVLRQPRQDTQHGAIRTRRQPRREQSIIRE
jgi:hypothetical protein